MYNNNQKRTISQIRRNGWAIKNRKECYDYNGTEIEENSNIEDIIFLSIGHSKEINDEWMKKIGYLVDLRSLYVTSTDITDLGITYLKNLNELKYLSVQGNNLTDKSIETISKFPKLEYLWLNETNILGNYLQLFSQTSQLKNLWLNKTKICDDTLKHISGPACRVSL